MKPVGTPCIDDYMIPPEGFATKGKLSFVAARTALKALYLARINRPFILWTVNKSARTVTKWNVASYQRLRRLISYIRNTDKLQLISFVGDKPETCKVVQFSDALFSADLSDSKNTTGAFFCTIGLNTYVPLSWVCEKQGSVSHSSSEAETIALEAGLRKEGIPYLTLWSEILEVLDPRTNDKDKEKRKKHKAGMVWRGQSPTHIHHLKIK